MVDINSEVSEKVKKKSEQKAKTETIFLGNLKDNLISKIGSKITITDFDKGIDLKENILQSDTKNILIIEHPNCRKINDSLLSEDEDISAPIFDNYNKVVDFVTELKERLGKEKDLNFYFVCFNENALENINVDKAIKELSNLKLRNLAYFDRYNITSSFDRLKKFFHLNNYFSFYDNHKEKIGTKDFMYQSKKYRWNDDQGKPILMQPAWAKDLKFIGDDYFEIEDSINAKGHIEGKKLIRRKRSTLKNRFGESFAKYFKDYYYHGFANIPNNYNYQAVHHKYYNRYSKIPYEPKEGKIDNALGMVKHVFGVEKITHNGKTLKRFEIALDYLQILITEPTHPLPILILFSVERETGKSTFPAFIKMILGANSVKVGNKAFDSEFNEIFADKLLIWCDETLLDRKQQAEKIKDLSTSKQILVNPKGSGQYEIPFFGKFIFTSNNKRMVYVDKNSVRFWINKVPSLKNDDPLFIEKLEAEIPAFLHFLKHRKLLTKRESRMHFSVNWIKTEALEETVKVNEPRDVAHLRECIKEMFLDIEENGNQIKMSMKDINTEFFGGKKDKPWIKEILTDYFEIMSIERLCKYSFWKFDREGKRTIYKEEGNKNGKPTSVENTEKMEISQHKIKVKRTGRPYLFQRSKFCND